MQGHSAEAPSPAAIPAHPTTPPLRWQVTLDQQEDGKLNTGRRGPPQRGALGLP